MISPDKTSRPLWEHTKYLHQNQLNGRLIARLLSTPRQEHVLDQKKPIVENHNRLFVLRVSRITPSSIGWNQQ
jgi:hypothetical protein